MKKHIDDIIPPEDRSIRNVSVSREGRRRSQRQRPQEEHTPSPARRERHDVYRRRKAPRWGLWVISGVAVLAVLIFGLSFLFSGAKVIVTPKQRTVPIAAEFQASRTPSLTELGYEVMTIEREGSREVSASGEEYVEEKASGTIIVYNNFNSSDQRLIKNTRFESPDGKIYRINESIVVPGQRTEGNTTVPGSIEAVVYADEVGEEYNIGLTDFTIPGFEGSPRFEGFYARSKTAMTGGFVGEKKIVQEADEVRAREEIQRDIREQISQEALAQKPEGFELFENGTFIVFTSLPNQEKGNDAVIREKATLYGVLFKQEAFAAFLAENTVAGYNDGDSVRITNPQDLNFTILNKSEQEPWNDNAFQFEIDGTAHIVWEFDSQQLKNDLIGKSKDAFTTVLTGYPSIEEAQIILRPFWRQTFPEEIEDIKVTTIIDK